MAWLGWPPITEAPADEARRARVSSASDRFSVGSHSLRLFASATTSALHASKSLDVTCAIAEMASDIAKVTAKGIVSFWQKEASACPPPSRRRAPQLAAIQSELDRVAS